MMFGLYMGKNKEKQNCKIEMRNIIVIGLSESGSLIS